MSPVLTESLPGAHARSILSCPASVDLTVDGIPHPLADDQRLSLQDDEGLPTFLCLPDGALAQAAATGRNTLLTVRTGLRGRVAWDTLVLAGSLRSAGPETCACCRDARERVVVDVTFVLLTRTVDGETVDRRRVPVADFGSPAHHLNAGYLQRCAEHVSTCHQDALRSAVATRAWSRPADVAGARLADLSPSGAQLEWVDMTGAHSARLPFPHRAQTGEELARLLRDELHADIC